MITLATASITIPARTTIFLNVSKFNPRKWLLSVYLGFANLTLGTRIFTLLLLSAECQFMASYLAKTGIALFLLGMLMLIGIKTAITLFSPLFFSLIDSRNITRTHLINGISPDISHF